MNLMLEIVSEPILQIIAEKAINLDINVNEIAQTTALEILGKIKNILCDQNMDDIEKLNCIVGVFNDYNIDTNGCCDY